MKTAKQLKIAIDTFFVLLIVSLIYLFISPLINLLSTHGVFEETRELGFSAIPMLVVALVPFLKTVLFTLAVYYLRKAIKPLLSLQFFSNVVTENLKKAGILLLAVGSISFIGSLVSLSIIGDILLLGSNTIGANNFLLLIVFGLFLILLDKILSNARQLQEENDLTI